MGFFDTIKKGFSSVGNAIAGAATSVYNTVKGGVEGVFHAGEKIVNKVVDTGSDVIGKVADTGSKVIEKGVDTVSDTVGKVGSVFSIGTLLLVAAVGGSLYLLTKSGGTERIAIAGVQAAGKAAPLMI